MHWTVRSWDEANFPGPCKVGRVAQYLNSFAFKERVRKDKEKLVATQDGYSRQPDPLSMMQIPGPGS
jgi:hypothetical protein